MGAIITNNNAGVVVAPRRNSTSSNRTFIFFLLCIVVALVLLVNQQVQQSLHNYHHSDMAMDLSGAGSAAAVIAFGNSNNRNNNMNASIQILLQHNPLMIPPGQPPNLPSLRHDDDENNENNNVVDKQRQEQSGGHVYGGKGDGKHLGGFIDLDLHGISPQVWKYMLTAIGIHSIMDVGCGRGISTSWFVLHGVQTMCVEGSHDAIQQSIVGQIVPTDTIIEHDFSRGPWWPAQTYDAVWAVEFLEHVGINYMYNYISTFRKAALLFVTSSRWGGWHHVEVHSDDWWIRKYESFGFKYDANLTQTIRNIAIHEVLDGQGQQMAPNGDDYNAQHIWLTMKVFINPMVASLPQHAHLFFEHGCFAANKKYNPHRKCGGITRKGGNNNNNQLLESTLPPSFFPLQLTSEQDMAWYDLIRKNIQTTKPQKKRRNKPKFHIR